MRGRVGRGLVASASVAVLGGLLWPGAGGAWLLALAAATLPVGLVALATADPGRARPSGRPSPSIAALVAIWTLLAGSAAGLLALAGAPPGAAVGGLPVATWLLVLGLGAAPLVLVAWVYVAGFDGRGLTAAELAHLRRFRPPERPGPANRPDREDGRA